MVLVKANGAGALFRLSGPERPTQVGVSMGLKSPTLKQTAPTGGARSGALHNWAAVAERAMEAKSSDKANLLASELGVTPDSLKAVQCGLIAGEELKSLRARWEGDAPEWAYVFPERDGSGRIIGLSLRAMDGRKSAPSGAKRGLVVPSDLHNLPGPVLVVEGASDVAACSSLRLAAVGRPSNASGAQYLAELLEDREFIILGENDSKVDGSWPGRDGAKSVAARIAATHGESVKRALPPRGSKDVRSWLQSRLKNGLNLLDQVALTDAGAELMAAIQSTAKETKPGKSPSQSELIVRLAHEKHRIGLAEGDEPFAVPHGGPNVAMMFRGSRDALRCSLAREFRNRYQSTASASALADAMTALQGDALECPAEPVHLRLAEWNGSIVMDLGTTDGTAVVIHPNAWEVVDVSPVLFKRTALTGTLPEPERGGTLEQLRDLVNVAETDWPLLMGWLVCAMLPWSPHPILILGGLQGSGKSFSARLLLGLFDPSTVPLRPQPTDPEHWAFSTAGSWGVVIDNVSSISHWWSDLLCKASTGDGWIRRRLYTDSDLSVWSFRRVVALTSIDAGALKGDLGERLLMLDLAQISRRRRRTERELERRYAELRPLLFGALLDLTAAVLGKLTDPQPDDLPRMADFAVVLAAMDRAVGTNSLQLYERQDHRIAEEVIESDEIAMAIVAFSQERCQWAGTAQELLKCIRPADGDKAWPNNGRGLAGRLRRLIPALGRLGVIVTLPAPTDKTRQYHLQYAAPNTESPDGGSNNGETGDTTVIDADAGSSNRPAETCLETNENAVDGLSGDQGDSSGNLSSGTSDTDLIPAGWTKQGWTRRLRSLANGCENTNLARATELRAAAARLENGPSGAA